MINMVRAYCPAGRHWPEYIIVFLDKSIDVDASEIGIVLDNHGKATDQWGDGVVGVPKRLKMLAEEEEDAYCLEHREEIDWIHKKRIKGRHNPSYGMEMKDVGTGNRMSMVEFRRGYVDAHYPNLTCYAYRAEIVSISKGQRIMNQILRGVDWIEDWPHGHPILHMKDGRKLFVQDSEDFPQPTDAEPE